MDELIYGICGAYAVLCILLDKNYFIETSSSSKKRIYKHMRFQKWSWRKYIKYNLQIKQFCV